MFPGGRHLQNPPTGPPQPVPFPSQFYYGAPPAVSNPGWYQNPAPRPVPPTQRPVQHEHQHPPGIASGSRDILADSYERMRNEMRSLQGVQPAAPPPPSMDATKGKIDPLTQLLGNKDVSLSSLLEAAMDPSLGTGSRVTKTKSILDRCEEKLMQIYNHRLKGEGSFFPDSSGSEFIYINSKSVLNSYPLLDFNGNPDDAWLLFDDSEILQKKENHGKMLNKPGNESRKLSLPYKTAGPGPASAHCERVEIVHAEKSRGLVTQPKVVRGGFLKPNLDEDVNEQPRASTVQAVNLDRHSERSIAYRDSRSSISSDSSTKQGRLGQDRPLREPQTSSKIGPTSSRTKRSKSREPSRSRPRSPDRWRNKSRDRERKSSLDRRRRSSRDRMDTRKEHASRSHRTFDSAKKKSEDLKSFAEKLKANPSEKNKTLSDVRLSSRLEDTKVRRGGPIAFSIKKPVPSFGEKKLPDGITKPIDKKKAEFENLKKNAEHIKDKNELEIKQLQEKFQQTAAKIRGTDDETAEIKKLQDDLRETARKLKVMLGLNQEPMESAVPVQQTSTTPAPVPVPAPISEHIFSETMKMSDLQSDSYKELAGAAMEYALASKNLGVPPGQVIPEMEPLQMIPDVHVLGAQPVMGLNPMMGPMPGHMHGPPPGIIQGPPPGVLHGPPLGLMHRPPLGHPLGPPHGPPPGHPLGPPPSHSHGPPLGLPHGPPSGHPHGPPPNFMGLPPGLYHGSSSVPPRGLIPGQLCGPPPGFARLPPGRPQGGPSPCPSNLVTLSAPPVMSGKPQKAVPSYHKPKKMDIPNIQKIQFIAEKMKLYQGQSDLNDKMKEMKEKSTVYNCEYAIKHGLYCKVKNPTLEDSALLIVVPNEPEVRQAVVTAFIHRYPDWTLDQLVEFLDQSFWNLPIEDVEDAYENENRRMSNPDPQVTQTQEADGSNVCSPDKNIQSIESSSAMEDNTNQELQLETAYKVLHKISPKIIEFQSKSPKCRKLLMNIDRNQCKGHVVYQGIIFRTKQKTPKVLLPNPNCEIRDAVIECLHSNFHDVKIKKFKHTLWNWCATDMGFMVKDLCSNIDRLCQKCIIVKDVTTHGEDLGSTKILEPIGKALSLIEGAPSSSGKETITDDVACEISVRGKQNDDENKDGPAELSLSDPVANLGNKFKVESEENMCPVTGAEVIDDAMKSGKELMQEKDEILDEQMLKYEGTTVKKEIQVGAVVSDPATDNSCHANETQTAFVKEESLVGIEGQDLELTSMSEAVAEAHETEGQKEELPKALGEEVTSPLMKQAETTSDPDFKVKIENVHNTDKFLEKSKLLEPEAACSKVEEFEKIEEVPSEFSNNEPSNDTLGTDTEPDVGQLSEEITDEPVGETQKDILEIVESSRADEETEVHVGDTSSLDVQNLLGFEETDPLEKLDSQKSGVVAEFVLLSTKEENLVDIEQKAVDCISSEGNDDQIQNIATMEEMPIKVQILAEKNVQEDKKNPSAGILDLPLKVEKQLESDILVPSVDLQTVLSEQTGLELTEGAEPIALDNSITETSQSINEEVLIECSMTDLRNTEVQADFKVEDGYEEEPSVGASETQLNQINQECGVKPLVPGGSEIHAENDTPTVEEKLFSVEDTVSQPLVNEGTKEDHLRDAQATPVEEISDGVKEDSVGEQGCFSGMHDKVTMEIATTDYENNSDETRKDPVESKVEDTNNDDEPSENELETKSHQINKETPIVTAELGIPAEEDTLTGQEEKLVSTQDIVSQPLVLQSNQHLKDALENQEVSICALNRGMSKSPMDEWTNEENLTDTDAHAISKDDIAKGTKIAQDSTKESGCTSKMEDAEGKYGSASSEEMAVDMPNTPEGQSRDATDDVPTSQSPGVLRESQDKGINLDAVGPPSSNETVPTKPIADCMIDPTCDIPSELVLTENAALPVMSITNFDADCDDDNQRNRTGNIEGTVNAVVDESESREDAANETTTVFEESTLACESDNCNIQSASTKNEMEAAELITQQDTSVGVSQIIQPLESTVDHIPTINVEETVALPGPSTPTDHPALIEESTTKATSFAQESAIAEEQVTLKNETDVVALTHDETAHKPPMIQSLPKKKFQSLQELILSNEEESVYQEPDFVKFLNCDRLLFFFERLREIQQSTTILLPVINKMKSSTYSHSDCFVMKDGLLGKRTNDNSVDLFIVLSKSTLTYKEIVSALSEEYPDLEFSEFMSLIDSSFSYVTPAEIAALSESLDTKKICCKYQQFLNKCQIVNWDALHPLHFYLVSAQKLSEKLQTLRQTLLMNNGISETHCLKHDLVCSLYEGIYNWKVVAPEGYNAQFWYVMKILHSKFQYKSLDEMKQFLLKTFADISLEKYDFTKIFSCSVIEKAKQKIHKKLPALSTLPSQILFKMRQLQMSSSMFSAQINLLTKGESRAGGRYVLGNNLLCKAVVIEDDTVYRAVIPTSCIKELIIVLHLHYHRKSLDDFFKFVQDFLLVSRESCEEVFQDCDLCRDSQGKPSLEQTALKNKPSKESCKPSTEKPDNDKTSCTSSKVLKERRESPSCKGSQDSTNQRSSGEGSMSKSKKAKNLNSDSKLKNIKVSSRLREAIKKEFGSVTYEKLVDSMYNIRHVLDEVSKWQMESKVYLPIIKKVSNKSVNRKDKHLLFKNVLFETSVKNHFKIALKEYPNINYKLITKLHARHHDWNQKKLLDFINTNFDTTVTKEEVSSTINVFCNSCKKEISSSLPKIQKKAGSSIDSELADFYSSIKTSSKTAKGEAKDEIEPKKRRIGKPKEDVPTTQLLSILAKLPNSIIDNIYQTQLENFHTEMALVKNDPQELASKYTLLMSLLCKIVKVKNEYAWRVMIPHQALPDLMSLMHFKFYHELAKTEFVNLAQNFTLVSDDILEEVFSKCKKCQQQARKEEVETTNIPSVDPDGLKSYLKAIMEIIPDIEKIQSDSKELSNIISQAQNSNDKMWKDWMLYKNVLFCLTKSKQNKICWKIAIPAEPGNLKLLVKILHSQYHDLNIESFHYRLSFFAVESISQKRLKEMISEICPDCKMCGSSDKLYPPGCQDGDESTKAKEIIFLELENRLTILTNIIPMIKAWQLECEELKGLFETVQKEQTPGYLIYQEILFKTDGGAATPKLCLGKPSPKIRDTIIECVHSRFNCVTFKKFKKILNSWFTSTQDSFFIGLRSHVDRLCVTAGSSKGTSGTPATGNPTGVLLLEKICDQVIEENSRSPAALSPNLPVDSPIVGLSKESSGRKRNVATRGRKSRVDMCRVVLKRLKLPSEDVVLRSEDSSCESPAPKKVRALDFCSSPQDSMYFGKEKVRRIRKDQLDEDSNSGTDELTGSKVEESENSRSEPLGLVDLEGQSACEESSSSQQNVQNEEEVEGIKTGLQEYEDDTQSSSVAVAKDSLDETSANEKEPEGQEGSLNSTSPGVASVENPVSEAKANPSKLTTATAKVVRKRGRPPTAKHTNEQRDPSPDGPVHKQQCKSPLGELGIENKSTIDLNETTLQDPASSSDVPTLVTPSKKRGRSKKIVSSELCYDSSDFEDDRRVSIQQKSLTETPIKKPSGMKKKKELERVLKDIHENLRAEESSDESSPTTDDPEGYLVQQIEKLLNCGSLSQKEENKVTTPEVPLLPDSPEPTKVIDQPDEKMSSDA